MKLAYTHLKVSDVFRVLFVKTEWVYIIKGWCFFSISKYWVFPRGGDWWGPLFALSAVISGHS